MLVKAFFKEFLVEKKAWLTVKSSGGTENSLSPPSVWHTKTQCQTRTTAVAPVDQCQLLEKQTLGEQVPPVSFS